MIVQVLYWCDSHAARLLEDVSTSYRRHARALPEKYRAEQLVAAALRTDGTGPRLAELYLQRAYKLLGEDYADIPPIENEIRSLLQPPESGAPTSNES